MKILCIGEVMAEISGPPGQFRVGFAGDTFNTAVYCQRLLKGKGQASYLTRLGHDPLSGACRLFAQEHALDLSHCASDAEANIGIYAVQTDDAGERTFSYWRSNSAARKLFQDAADFDALNGAELIYFSGITLAVMAPSARAALFDRLAALKLGGVRIAFDSNYRPKLWECRDTAQQVITQAWALDDLALPSLDDEMALFGDADEEAVLMRLNGLGCHHGALKRGALGPLPLDRSVADGGEFLPADKVIDSTAAGDSFNAGYLAATALGHSQNMAMAWGHSLAAQVVAQRGAIVSTAEM
ncbi:sugar kinase [Hoeflea sp. G2-23]|uniref:Sugar kinase n=1 Tax=Hoeflea algicola TaxID=2983763 RepID=A0ABT3ZE98_9HYPH|nr:sugar kinase [Hoeflea algicola]MCY0150088.1 sugar kinase [Hoeflea algicola]